MIPFAVFFGMFAGYFRGWVDHLISYVYTTISSIPGVLLIGASILSLQVIMDNHAEWFLTVENRGDVHLLALCAILGLTTWTSLCRLIRAETMKISEFDFIHASRTMGLSDMRILWKHIMPNLMHVIAITVAMDFSGLVLAETVLTYVGVGVDPHTASWGAMLGDARDELTRDPIVWWPLCGAFVFMLIFVLSANIIADAVRDVYDVKRKNNA
jgi:peptide/nickel transport system permease protein